MRVVNIPPISIGPNGPLLVIPGRINGAVTTLQFIAEDGTKKNILGGAMMGASHRIAVGPQVWVCEGIATALSVRFSFTGSTRSEMLVRVWNSVLNSVVTPVTSMTVSGRIGPSDGWPALFGSSEQHAPYPWVNG